MVTFRKKNKGDFFYDYDVFSSCGYGDIYDRL